jgi:hypothetical protein
LLGIKVLGIIVDLISFDFLCLALLFFQVSFILIILSFRIFLSPHASFPFFVNFLLDGFKIIFSSELLQFLVFLKKFTALVLQSIQLFKGPPILLFCSLNLFIGGG